MNQNDEGHNQVSRYVDALFEIILELPCAIMNPKRIVADKDRARMISIHSTYSIMVCKRRHVIRRTTGIMKQIQGK